MSAQIVALLDQKVLARMLSAIGELGLNENLVELDV